MLTSKIYASVQNYSEIGKKYGVQEQKLKNSSFTALLAKSSDFPPFSVFRAKSRMKSKDYQLGLRKCMFSFLEINQI